MENLKAVFFDADDTLIDHEECERQGLIYLFENIGISYKNEYQHIFRPLDRKLWNDASHHGSPIPIEAIPTYRFKVLFELIDIKYDNYSMANDLFKEGLAASAALIENTEEIVNYLHNKGLILCVVTNGLISLQRPRVANSAVGKFISHIIVSEEVGAHKPNPIIFYTLLERLMLDARNTIMIGDSLENDIRGAKNAGIKTIWYNPAKKENKTSILPNYEISNLLQITSII